MVGREGEETIELAVAVGIFLGLGAVHNFLAYSKENAQKCSCRAEYGVSLRLKSQFTPIEKNILPA